MKPLLVIRTLSLLNKDRLHVQNEEQIWSGYAILILLLHVLMSLRPIATKQPSLLKDYTNGHSTVLFLN